MVMFNKELEEKELFDALSIFDGEGGGEGAEDKGAGADDKGDKGGEDDKGGKDDKKPFATFADEKSFMSRVGREAKKQMSEMLKSLGIDGEETLKKVVADKKANDEAEKTDLEKANEKATAAEQKATAAEARANKIALEAETKIQAVAAGIDPKRVAKVLKMIDISEVEVKDGKVDVDGLNEKINELLEEFPEFKAGKKNEIPDSSGGKDKDDLKGGKDKPLTLEAIKAMTPKEAAARIDEIRKFMNKK